MSCSAAERDELMCSSAGVPSLFNFCACHAVCSLIKIITELCSTVTPSEKWKTSMAVPREQILEQRAFVRVFATSISIPNMIRFDVRKDMVNLHAFVPLLCYYFFARVIGQAKTGYQY